jgi:hypothetical protein
LAWRPRRGLSNFCPFEFSLDKTQPHWDRVPSPKQLHPRDSHRSIDNRFHSGEGPEEDKLPSPFENQIDWLTEHRLSRGEDGSQVALPDEDP